MDHTFDLKVLNIHQWSLAKFTLRIEEIDMKSWNYAERELIQTKNITILINFKTGNVDVLIRYKLTEVSSRT